MMQQWKKEELFPKIGNNFPVDWKVNTSKSAERL